MPTEAQQAWWRGAGAGALQGGATGATLGSVAGLPGAAIGAGVGAAIGLLFGGKQAKKEFEEQQRLERLAKQQAKNAQIEATRAAKESTAVAGPSAIGQSGQESPFVRAAGAAGQFDAWHAGTFGG